jgi:hypothetical protein
VALVVDLSYFCIGSHRGESPMEKSLKDKPLPTAHLWNTADKIQESVEVIADPNHLYLCRVSPKRGRKEHKWFIVGHETHHEEDLYDYVKQEFGDTYNPRSILVVCHIPISLKDEGLHRVVLENWIK